MKTALVTGGSRGIGAATVRLLAGQGYRVCINYRHNHEAAEALVRELQQSGDSVMALQADIALEDEVNVLFAKLQDTWGRVDALVNNAGILLPQMTIVGMDAKRINQLFAVNVTGCLLCCREAVKQMAYQYGGRGGRIVNVSSAAARLGSPHEYIDYAASKGAVDTLTSGLAKEWAAEGIRVNAVRPGFIDTDMHADGGEPDRIERLKPMIPLGRGGEPHEVAAAIAWLLSDEASYVTGSFVDVSGGR